MIQKITKDGVTFVNDGFTTLESGRKFTTFGILTNGKYVDYQFLVVEQTDDIFTSIRRDEKIAVISPIMYIKSPNGKLDFLLKSRKIIFSRKTCKDKYGNHLSYDELVSEALTAASAIWKLYTKFNN